VGANWTDCCNGGSVSELMDNGTTLVVCSRTEPIAVGATNITGGTTPCNSNAGGECTTTTTTTTTIS